MSKLDELLQGVDVEWKALGEVCEIIRGVRVTKKDLIENGKYPVVSGGTGYMGFVNEYNREENSITIAQYGTAGFVKWQNEKFWANDVAFTIYPINEDILLKRFLYYFLINKQNYLYDISNKIAVPFSISKEKILQIKIPIPCPDNPEKSLEIQQEIVRVLDELTSLTNQLTTELETERQNRKKQFEFFREQLFRFEEKEVKYISLGELSKIGDGLHGTPKYNDSGNYYFINGNNLNSGEILITDRTKKVDDNTYNKYGIEFSKNKTIFLSINGTIGSVSFYNDEKIVLGKSVAYFNIISNELLHKYLYYIFQLDFSKNYFEKNKTGSTIKNLGLKALRSFKIPILPLEEQERIVKLLDQFDATHTAIEEEISKEIKLRTQQYEYYREKLLSFPQN